MSADSPLVMNYLWFDNAVRIAIIDQVGYNVKNVQDNLFGLGTDLAVDVNCNTVYSAGSILKASREADFALESGNIFNNC